MLKIEIENNGLSIAMRKEDYQPHSPLSDCTAQIPRSAPAQAQY
jgi:hypothetical protein